MRSFIVLIGIALILCGNVAMAAKPVYSGGKLRVAIKGYDPVAYFTQGVPVLGSKQHSLEYKGAKWLFSTAEHKALFEKNPERYEPQYGGYCAYAIAKNTTASIRPEFFTIHDGKLYLNYSQSVNKKWLKDKQGYIDKAEKNWPGLQN